MAKQTKLIVTNVRYFETNRGLGYEATTQFGSIWNDGNGGCTYFEHNCEEGKTYRNTPEDELEQAINIYEGVESLQITKNKVDIKDYIVSRLKSNRNIYNTWLKVRSLHINDNLETFWQACIRLECDGRGEILHSDEPNKETLAKVVEEFFIK